MTGSGDSTESRVKAVLAGETDLERWANPENLEASWEPRSRFVAQLIGRNSTVLDLGCGRMLIEKHLRPGCTYLPADVARRDDRTLHCDINRGELPGQIDDVDIVLMLGVIEYVFDLPALFARLARGRGRVMVTYCDPETSRLSSFEQRAALGWVNALSRNDLKALFAAAGLRLLAEDQVDGLQWIYTLATPAYAVRPQRVAVLSYANAGNFGDRLGMHLLSSIMPAHASVEFLNFRPWQVPEEAPDLLVLGIGNSMFGPLLDDSLFKLIERSGKTLGIFGTQYRQEYPATRMKQLVSALDVWFARHETDLDLYATPDTRCEHLGDWLIDAFMMTTPVKDDAILKIGDEVKKNLPLDRIITQIQQYRRVFSTRMHPLLCALTSAEQVAYVEQRESGTGQVSGKFESMLLDIFGRTYPENRLWTVDRTAVMHYRDQVRRKMSVLENTLSELLA
jgi:hypothetical protein